MCGAFGYTSGSALERYGTQYDPGRYLGWKPRYNIRPSQFAPIVTSKKELKFARFGLLPSWAKDPKIAYMMINSRSETLDKKPSFIKPLKQSRCGIFADFYFEWFKNGKEKIPYLFKLKSGEPFLFAGLSDHNEIAEDKPVDTFSIITGEAPKELAEIHNRVPIILKPTSAKIWLDDSVEDTKKLLGLLQPISPSQMEWYPVSTLVNRPANDSPELIKPITS